MPKRTYIRHIVFFSASDEADIPIIVDGLKLLKDIPYSKCFEVVENKCVDNLSSEVDVVVYAEFETTRELEAYKAHPIYQKSIDVVRPLRELRIVADI